MKRWIINVSVAVVAFCVGVSSELAFAKYLELTSPRPETIQVPTPSPADGTEAQLARVNLPAELQRIDETYRKRCQLPAKPLDGWPLIKQLHAFRLCNDEWATARRQAITTELDSNLVQY